MVQLSLFPEIQATFPSTRYQGSKAKLADWIGSQIADLPFHTCLDAFGGTGAVAYRLKQAGKSVTYNDLLRFNALIGQALIANAHTRLSEATVKTILTRSPHFLYPQIVQDNFSDIYFTDSENAWIDQTITNLYQLAQPEEFAIGFFALCQACIVKRPYNLFHRKNLYIRFAEVERSFGNKTSWDKPFEDWFRFFVDEANQAVFDNGKVNQARQCDVMDISEPYDLVYLDPPYVSHNGIGINYRDFYHFLEGLANYTTWPDAIDYRSKHHRLIPKSSVWASKQDIYTAFEHLFAHFKNSIIVVSYRTDGIPSETALIALLKQYSREVRVVHYGQYQYALSTNRRSGEMLLIGLP